MGILDLPAPVFAWGDMQLAAVPAVLRIVVWGGVAALFSMGLYRLISPQRRLACIAAEERSVRDRLRGETAELSDGLGMARRLLRLALLRFGLVLPPAAVSIVPVLCLMAWLNANYAYDLPAPGSAVPVRVEPEIGHGRVVAATDETPQVEVRDGGGAILQSVFLSAPVPVIHKRAWWNALTGNPLGYLPADAPIDRIELGLSERRYLPVGPSWAANWQAVFFAALLAGSLLLHRLFRIR